MHDFISKAAGASEIPAVPDSPQATRLTGRRLLVTRVVAFSVVAVTVSLGIVALLNGAQ